MSRDPLEYVLNRMEAASQSEDPARDGYGSARRELLNGIATLRSSLADAKEHIKALEEENAKLRGWYKDYTQSRRSVRGE